MINFDIVFLEGLLQGSRDVVFDIRDFKRIDSGVVVLKWATGTFQRLATMFVLMRLRTWLPAAETRGRVVGQPRRLDSEIAQRRRRWRRWRWRPFSKSPVKRKVMVMWRPSLSVWQWEGIRRRAAAFKGGWSVECVQQGERQGSREMIVRNRGPRSFEENHRDAKSHDWQDISESTSSTGWGLGKRQ